jgi:CheY-like chemotaxis protein
LPFEAAIFCTLLDGDDETTNYFLNQKLLHRITITDTVLVAGNGQQALHLLHNHCAAAASRTCPAFILPDMKMLLMTGFEFLPAYTQSAAVPWQEPFS